MHILIPIKFAHIEEITHNGGPLESISFNPLVFHAFKYRKSYRPLLFLYNLKPTIYI